MSDRERSRRDAQASGALFVFALNKLVDAMGATPARAPAPTDPDLADGILLARIVRATEKAQHVLKTTGNRGKALRELLADIKDPAPPKDETVAKLIAELKNE